MLAPTKRVLDLYDNDEFEIFIITGKNGYGKTTYANRIIAEVYSLRMQDKWHGDGKTPNWSIPLFRKHMGYHPHEVKKQWDKMRARDYVYHWDDAGVWLSAYDHQDRYIRSISKYLQTARSDWGCIIFSAIDKSDIVSKIRNFKSAVIVDITKEGAETNSPKPSHRNRRTAFGWHYWEDRLNKIGTENDWEEFFDSHVPGKYIPAHNGLPTIREGFYGWYKPLRDKYARQAKRQIKYVDKDT